MLDLFANKFQVLKPDGLGSAIINQSGDTLFYNIIDTYITMIYFTIQN